MFTLQVFTLEEETSDDLNQNDLVSVLAELFQEVIVAFELQNDACHGMARVNRGKNDLTGACLRQSVIK